MPDRPTLCCPAYRYKHNIYDKDTFNSSCVLPSILLLKKIIERDRLFRSIERRRHLVDYKKFLHKKTNHLYNEGRLS